MITSALLMLVTAQGVKEDLLLDDLQKRAVAFFWEQSHPATGFTKDRAANDVSKPPPNDIASSASVGFALAAYTVGVERKWLGRDEALARTRLTLRNLLAKWPHEHGWLFHFVDWKTGASQWNSEASTIDTSICLAGVQAAERYWRDAEVTRDAQAFAKRIDWQWALTDGGAAPDAVHFTMGWKPNEGFLKARWENFDENKMLYLQAYGGSTVRTDGWDKMRREPVTYKGLDMIRGGPLFMHQMTESFYDFRGMRDRQGYSYAVESRNAALGNRQYCIDNPKGFKAYGPDFWGLSACDFPGGYNAFGAPGWIDDGGTITPTSAVASVVWLPKEAAAFAHNMRTAHPQAWGRYGFPNGYNPTQNWVGPDVIGIDLGMMLLAIENHRTGMVWRLTKGHPDIRGGYARMGFRDAKDAEKGPLRSAPAG